MGPFARVRRGHIPVVVFSLLVSAACETETAAAGLVVQVISDVESRDRGEPSDPGADLDDRPDATADAEPDPVVTDGGDPDVDSDRDPDTDALADADEPDDGGPPRDTPADTDAPTDTPTDTDDRPDTPDDGPDTPVDTDVPRDTEADSPPDTAPDSPPDTAPDSPPDTPDVPTDVGGDADVCGNAPGQLFPPGAPWNTSIEGAPLDAESAAIIDYLQHNSDSGGTLFQIDRSIHRLEADAETPRFEFSPTGSHYSPDCDTAPVPLPPGGAVEGHSGYTCESGGDCHVIVRDLSDCRLYEQWRADVGTGGYEGGCLAIWDLAEVPPPTGRGRDCTSADAAGLPIAPLLFDADEVAAGEILHAIRFILPNSNIRAQVYVQPATHSTGATRGPIAAPPYGARLRLRSDFDMSVFDDSPAATIVARALQRYGMFLADGGRVTFTAESDRFTEASWDDVGMSVHDLRGLEWTDFEVVDGGTRYSWIGDCRRVPIVE